MKKVCIVGTFGTWRQTPFNDPSFEIRSLNDAYVMGLPRADVWYEQHPFDKMWFRPADPHAKVDPKDIPTGAYIRPHNHLEWLKTQAKTIPVWLQQTPPTDWPANAQRFPLEAVEAAFGSEYWTCGPSYMLAQAWLQGHREIWITGIHLATQHEYIEQRPGYESLISRMLGQKWKTIVKKQFRYFEGEQCLIVMPESCPILNHRWKYAYEPKPIPAPDPYAEEWDAVQKEKTDLIRALVNWPTGKDKSREFARLQRLEIIEQDITQQRQKRAISSRALVAELV